LHSIKADVASHFSEGDLSVTPRHIHKLFETESAAFSEYVLSAVWNSLIAY